MNNIEINGILLEEICSTIGAVKLGKITKEKGYDELVETLTNLINKKDE